MPRAPLLRRLVLGAGTLALRAVTALRAAASRRAGYQNAFIYSVAVAGNGAGSGRRAGRVAGNPVAGNGAGSGSAFPKRGDRVCVLLLRHANGEFGPPGGCIDPGESAWDAAKREFTEETGYRFRNDYKELLKLRYGAARLYVHAVRVLPPAGRPGSRRRGHEIVALRHFTIPQLQKMLRGEDADAPLRGVGVEALVRVLGEFEQRGYQ